MRSFSINAAVRTGAPALAWLRLDAGRWITGPGRTWVLLVTAAVLPLLLFGGWAGSFSAERARADTRRLAASKVQQVAARISAELRSGVDLAQALSASTALDDGELDAFRIEAQRLNALHPLWRSLELSTPDGAALLELHSAAAVAPGPTAATDSFQRVLRTGRPAIGGMGPAAAVPERRLVTLRVPVMRQGRLRYVLSMAMAPDRIGRILNTAGAPAAWIGVVVDASDHILARTRSVSERLGQVASFPLRDAIAKGPADAHVGYTQEGLQVETVTRILPDTGGWTVAFGIPTAILKRPVQRALLLFGAAGCAALALATALASLVTRDMTQRRVDERSRAERALRVSEERRALAVEAAELGSWRWDAEPDRFDGSPRCRSMLALPDTASKGPGESWGDAMAAIDPDDRPAVDTAFERCLAGTGSLHMEFRIRHRDGSQRWLRAVGRVLQGSGGQGRSLQGVMDDITIRKHAEMERQDLRRRLALAQEDERRRISRELHDQVGQTVTGLSLGLKALEQAGGVSSARVQSLQRLVAEIGRDIHRAAADLRPSALDDLGLQRALQALATNSTEASGIRIDMEAVGHPRRLSSEIETVIYRVVQEALTNILRHAEAQAVSVLLEWGAAAVRVIVEDDGVGFDTERLDGGAHLGLAGMRERLALVGGGMTIETAAAASGSGRGTTLFVQVPIAGLPGSPS